MEYRWTIRRGLLLVIVFSIDRRGANLIKKPVETAANAERVIETFETTPRRVAPRVCAIVRIIVSCARKRVLVSRQIRFHYGRLSRETVHFGSFIVVFIDRPRRRFQSHARTFLTTKRSLERSSFLPLPSYLHQPPAPSAAAAARLYIPRRAFFTAAGQSPFDTRCCRRQPCAIVARLLLSCQGNTTRSSRTSPITYRSNSPETTISFR